METETDAFFADLKDLESKLQQIACRFAADEWLSDQGCDFFCKYIAIRAAKHSKHKCSGDAVARPLCRGAAIRILPTSLAQLFATELVELTPAERELPEHDKLVKQLQKQRAHEDLLQTLGKHCGIGEFGSPRAALLLSFIFNARPGNHVTSHITLFVGRANARAYDTSHLDSDISNRTIQSASYRAALCLKSALHETRLLTMPTMNEVAVSQQPDRWQCGYFAAANMLSLIAMQRAGTWIANNNSLIVADARQQAEELRKFAADVKTLVCAGKCQQAWDLPLPKFVTSTFAQHFPPAEGKRNSAAHDSNRFGHPQVPTVSSSDYEMDWELEAAQAQQRQQDHDSL